jgi:SSS family solute:Na+ symporter
MTDGQVLRMTRAMVVVISAISYVVALFNPSSLVAMLLGAYGVIVQLLPLTLAVLYWQRATREGAYAGLITGGAVTLFFTFGPSTPLDVHAGIWGLIVNSIALVAVSFMTQPTAAAHTQKFIASSSESENAEAHAARAS